LVALRKEETFLKGDFKYVTLGENLLVYTRALDNAETYTVVINFGNSSEQVDLCPLLSKCPRSSKSTVEEIIARSTVLEVVISGVDSKHSKG
jgi:hypothetical protein